MEHTQKPLINKQLGGGGRKRISSIELSKKKIKELPHPPKDVIEAQIKVFWRRKKKVEVNELGAPYTLATVLLLYDWAGWTFKEIADFLQADQRTIKTWEFLGRMNYNVEGNVFTWYYRLWDYILYNAKYL